ncbi:MAG TPA: hypothetical protein VIM03_01950 [Thermoleophilaceae bacterium]
MSEDNITIRHSSEADRAELLRLAQLDDREVPAGESLLAYVGDELRAAVPLRGRGAIADPFHLTRDVIELLRVRARQERKAA